jgi:predicted ATPase
MYIRQVKLQDLRGFQTVKLKFERPGGKFAGWVAITGDNASGKTALLKAIALCLLGPEAIRSLQPSLRGWVRAHCAEAKAKVELVTGSRDHFIEDREPAKVFWSKLNIVAADVGEPSLHALRNYKGAENPKYGPWSEAAQGWFSAGYGPFRRLYGAAPDAQSIMGGPSHVARYATMFSEVATLGECEVWLKDLHAKRLEGRRQESETLQQLIEFLQDDFLPSGLAVDRVDSDGLWLRSANDVVLPMADVSEGYRVALALLLDIVRHMVLSFGHKGLIQLVNGQRILPHEGVVFIDEVDAHLHPEWQRQIGFWLKQRFPHVQFIVTTHSPLICQAADERMIFHLPSPGTALEPFQIGERDYREIIASRPDQIYRSPAFGMKHTLSPPMVAASHRYANLKAKQLAGLLSASEHSEMQRLRERITSNGHENGNP